MKLRRLDIKGFKSFANDTTVHFNDEIIGIVGPNGSGKSNIVDSIRWVLGEQKSRELRLEKMVDVIFNGTKSKKKAAFAQVSMTFENSKKLIPLEYDEIKVSRILYNTNESEYRINDVPCRLKDIRDLFLDTGIGSNSYAIIELGMVDDILSNKDNARRKMFEQAAGIAKYKTRKRETLLKLKNTQNDLDRVEDILFELFENLKKFEKQAKRTKRFYELKEEYKDVSIKQVMVSQKGALQKEIDLKTRLSQLHENFVELTNTFNTKEAELQQMKKANLDNESLLSQRQKSFNELIEEIRSLESSKAITKQNLDFANQNIDRVSNSINSAKKDLSDFQNEILSSEAKLNQLNSQSENLQATFQKWQTEFEAIENRRKEALGANDADLIELENLEKQRFDFEKIIIEKNTQTDAFNSNIQNLSSEKRSIITDLQTFQKEEAELKQKLNTLDEETQSIEEKIASEANKRREIEANIEAKKTERSNKERKKDAASNELNLLNDMLNNLEGFPESSKFLIKEWETKHPLLSDLIDCNEEYKSTIESYLDPYLNYFVVDNFEEARNSIELLKKAQKGRAKFFILSSFNEQAQEQVLFDSFGTPALSVSNIQAKYLPLLSHLLGKVVILDDQTAMDKALVHDDVIYLGKNDGTNKAKHTLSGGSVGLFDGKRIGRKQEITKLKELTDTLEREIIEINKELETLNSDLSAVNEAELQIELSNKQDLRNQLDVKRAQKQTMIASLTESLEQIGVKVDGFQSNTSLNQDDILNLRNQLQVVINSINTKKDLISSQSGFIEDIAKQFSEVSTQYNSAQLAWVQHTNELKNSQNNFDYKQEQIKVVQQKIDTLTQELDQFGNNISNLQSEIEKFENALVSKYEVRDAQKTELSEAEHSFFSKRNLVAELEDEIKSVNKKLQEKQLIINNTKDELTGIGFELRSSMERLKIEFDIDINSLNADEIILEIEDVEKLEIKYEKLKKRISNYGEINPMAVEAYDEILDRYENLETQKNDIIEAKESLHQTIKEIDNDAEGKFLEAFEQIKEHFKEVFRSLFSAEDDCDLILISPEEPLTSDIEIIAKPKGKRPKVLNQLSGGEKTLTATALLFSLYLLKPAPFCIFDEVDAPLDDINIQKFTKLIRRFADTSQFIIITHNKSTMANMDLLYGVYMQEQGVSGITQVDFKEYEHQEVYQTVSLN